MVFAHCLQIGKNRSKIPVLDVPHEEYQPVRGLIHLFAIHICNRFLRQTGDWFIT